MSSCHSNDGEARGARVTLLAIFLLLPAVFAQEKVTYQDHVLPLVENHCVRCHNPDKLKGDLDLSSYNGLTKGSASGQVVLSGNPESSKLFKAINHAEEPTMPPNKPKLPDKDLDVFRRWIAGGLLENSGSKAVAAKKPAVDLSLSVTDLGKPQGPPPMPGELLREPVLFTKRPPVITGMAHSPWAPLVALTGQRQLLLYRTDTAELLGVLPYPDGHPFDVTFSRSGQLLLSGGGHAAQSGQVVIWDVVTGHQVATVGNEYDAVLAADITPDQSRVALGGPDRLVKIHNVADGELLHKIKKHTDWVTAVAFSPNGQMLASADRNGGVNVWDPESGQLLFALAGHKASTTALSWREDSKILASGSEDGTIKWWESQEGRQVKTWNAHDGGVLTLAFSRDGKIVSGGRDKRVSLWDANGNKLRSIDGKAMVVQVAFTQDGTNIVAADFSGDVAIWDSKGTEVARLDANPPPLAMRLEALQKQILALESAHQTADSLTNGLALPQHQAQRKAEKHFASARERQTESEEAVKTLKEIAAGKEPPADIAEQLAAAREARAKARTAATKAGEVFQAAQKDFKTAHDKARGEAGQAREGLVKAKAQMARVQEALLFTPVYHARQRVVERKRKLEALAAVATAEEEESNRNSGAATDDQVSDVRAAAAKAAAQALADEEEKLKKLTAEYERGRRLGSTDAFNQ